ncbi:MAG: RagB/SusD family nutrient uptake outer membrane protein [Prevotella sp.]|jgi:hypothetical protein|nr:RagB/SusD family nutrient uptake outer membrane protein [Prevotella sp.]
MKKLYTIIIILLGFSVLPSCNYLDIIPDELPSEDDAFANRDMAKGFLYSCYGYIPNPRHATQSIDLYTSDEVITAFEHESFASFLKGDYTSVSPVISYWNSIFTGIRQCYIFLNRVDGVPDMDKETKQLYKAEATYLIAYYHYLLLRCYGPTIIVESYPDPFNSNPESYEARKPYDECVDWIASKFDEAVAMGLPEKFTGSDYGRATSTAARALKGRMLLYAASPLFNGGKSSEADTDDLSSYLASFVDKDGNTLMNTTYDAAKWKKAADALKSAIDYADAAGFRLYKETDLATDVPVPNNITERVLRMTIADRTTQEIIWPWCGKEDNYSLQNKSTPFDPNRDQSWNGVAPTMCMLEQFYTENGLPINEDPAYDYAKRYEYGNPPNTLHGTGTTMKLNMYREPRFYAWISYHNGNYEIKRNNTTEWLTQFRKNDNSGKQMRSTNFSPTGYLNKKGVHPNYAQGSGASGLVHYPWPVIRLGELYLDYAEALVETGDLATAKTYIDKIRNRAGLKGVGETWGSIGVTPDQAKMRQIVRQERAIELYLENQRFWDVRRWLLGKKYFNARPMGLNIEGTSDNDFFQVQDVGAPYVRKFLVPQHYLMPIPSQDMDRNPNVVQNPGY